MTWNDRPPFRADHVGSLLRPPALLEARARHAAGEIDADALREVEDQAVAEVVGLQRDAGLQTATDGELRRTSWHMDFIYQLEGVDSTDEKLQVHFRNADGDLDFESAALQVHDRVTLGETIFGDAFAFLAETVRQTADGLTPKLTIPSPSMVHYRGGRAAIDEDVYPDLDAVLDRPVRGVRRAAAPGRGPRLHLPPARRHQPRLPQRPEAARDRRRAGRGRRAPARAVHPHHQRRDRRPARGPAGHHAHVPRQLPLLVGGGGRLRLRRRGAVHRARRGRLLPGVRRRALGRLRAAALRARGQAGRARPGHHQERAARGQGRP